MRPLRLARSLGQRVFYSTQNKTTTHEIKNIASIQKLYMTDPVTPGSVFFLPHGTRIFNKLIQFMKVQQRKFGFEEVITPLIYKKDLWKQSGHWQHYKDDMFQLKDTDESDHEHDHGHEHDESDAGYSLKPMNCPGHCIIFSRQERSFRDLPVRFSDFSPLHRNEASGALTGLTRVRKFHQDDGHIFCLPNQVESEISSCLRLMESVYRIFGLNEYELTLSTRPEGYIGEIETWNQAESDLKDALNRSGKKWTVNEGDGAFYGPKIDILVKDNLGKQHQTATIQLDFQLPKNFELKYASHEQNLKTPVLVHRAIFGSLERFMAILIDHYQGKWPFWISPRQAVILPVASRHADYAYEIAKKLSGTAISEESAGLISERAFHVDVNSQEEPVGHRIRSSIAQSYNYILMVGDKEMESNTVSVRTRGSRESTSMKIPELHAMFCELEDKYN